MLVCNLVAPKSKVIGAVAKLITKTDVAGLARKDMITKIAAAESMLSEVWGLLGTGVSNNAITTSKANVLFGRLSNRTMLFLTKKEKAGYEQTAFASLGNIKQQLQDELATETGGAAPTTTAAG